MQRLLEWLQDGKIQLLGVLVLAILALYWLPSAPGKEIVGVVIGGLLTAYRGGGGQRRADAPATGANG